MCGWDCVCVCVCVFTGGGGLCERVDVCGRVDISSHSLCFALVLKHISTSLPAAPRSFTLFSLFFHLQLFAA